MGWKLLYIAIAWPLIGIVELLDLIANLAAWGHDSLVRFGVKMTKWFASK